MESYPKAYPAVAEFCTIIPPSVSEVEPDAKIANLSLTDRLVVSIVVVVPFTVKSPVTVTPPLNVAVSDD